MPEGAVYVGRPTLGGNPFVVGQPIPKVYLHVEFNFEDTHRYMNGEVVKDNAEAVRLYEKYGLPPKSYIKSLAGKDLADWCPLDKPCHADVLLRLANEESVGVRE